MSDELREIPLEMIEWPDETDITEEQIRNMASSILVHGQIEPIVVAITEEEGKYRGVCGRLRYEGMRDRWRGEPEGKTILARIRKFESETEIRMWQLAENLHRREISAMQRARQYRDLYDIMKKEAGPEDVLKKETGIEATIQTLADTIEAATGNKESVKTVQHYLSLTKLQPRTQEILTGEKLGLRYGLELLRIKDPKKEVGVAEAIKEDPDYYDNVQSVKWRVDSIVDTKRKEKHDKRLEKKAEELRAEGKIVHVGPSLSWEDKRKLHRFYDEIPKKCEDCPKLGILLEGNLQQHIICTDIKCYEKKQEEKNKRERLQYERREKIIGDEQVKVYGMEPDVRHWRLALYGLIDTWKLRNLLGLKKERERPMQEIVWDEVQTLNEELCKRLLIRHAVEGILIGPQYTEDPVKVWAVKEFNLKREVFLREEEI